MKAISRLFIALAMLACAGGANAAAKQKAVRTSALPSSLWQQAQWISAVNAPVVTGKVVDGTRAADGASWFVSTVKNEKKVVSAKWMVTSLGVFDIYINGQPVGDEVLRPGFTHVFKTRISFTYDVTRAINRAKGAENVLSAEVTPGWWADKIVTPAGTNGTYGTKCALRAVLELTYSDGSKQTFPTDTEHWRAGIAGPVKHAAIYDGEEYDARTAMGFESPMLLSKPEVNKEFKGEVVPSVGAEVYFRQDLALAPVDAYVWKDFEGKKTGAHGKVVKLREYKDGQPMTIHEGENLVIDFGQNCSAVPEFVFSGAAGTTLTCLPAELLNDSLGLESRGMDGPQGSVHRTNLRIPNTGMILKYTFSGNEGTTAWKPRKTFFGYRFVSITADHDVTISRIRSVPVTSIAQNLETGTITTGNELVNKLISNTIWGQRSNYLSVPTDCPQRNERLGWTADTQVFTETGTFFANTDPFFHKWMRDMRDTQSPLGGFPGVAPFGQYGSSEGDMMRVGWSDAGVIVPWTIWKQFGDPKIVDECWSSMSRYMQHMDETCYDHNKLKKENGNFQWGDWLSYEDLESCSGKIWGNGGLKPDAVEYWNYLNASYWAIDAGMMRDMAAATGRDAARYEQMVARAKQYIKDRFLNDDGTFKLAILNTMQTPALFALKNQLVSGSARDAMIKRLRDNFASHGNCLQTGFLGTSILMPTLSDNGMDDVAYELLLQRKNPSWLYSVDNGATTIWERWNSYTIDKGMGPAGMNSFNHYAYGSVCQWIWEYAAGIATDVKQPGFKHIIMHPQPDKRLGSLKAEYKSATGVIKSEWRYDGDQWIWKFSIPKGATASVTLPGETQSKEYKAGTYTVKK